MEFYVHNLCIGHCIPLMVFFKQASIRTAATKIPTDGLTTIRYRFKKWLIYYQNYVTLAKTKPVLLLLEGSTV